MSEFNELQLIKRRFFAMRNGVIADTLRKGGSPFKIIFGLNIPQIKDIARDLGPRPDLADALWSNTSTRESLLLAPMIMCADSVTQAQAEAMIIQSPSTEIVDNLCHSLLRNAPDAYKWAEVWTQSDTPILRYAAMRVLWHYLTLHGDKIRSLAMVEIERNAPLTRNIARMIVEEIDFLNGEN